MSSNGKPHVEAVKAIKICNGCRKVYAALLDDIWVSVEGHSEFFLQYPVPIHNGICPSCKGG